MNNYNWPISINLSRGSRPLQLKLESKTQSNINTLKSRHVKLLLSKISESLNEVLDSFDDNEINELYEDIGPVPDTPQTFLDFLDSIFTFNQDNNKVIFVLEKLEKFCKTDLSITHMEYIKGYWNLINQLYTEPNEENYLPLSKFDKHILLPLIDELEKENEVTDDSFILKNALSSLKPIRLQNFVKVHQVGQGAYGDVWLAEDIVNKTPVALKKLKLNEEREGFPKNAIREILLLNSLKHKNIVNLLGISYSRSINLNHVTDSNRDNPNKDNLNINKENKDTKNKEKENVWMVFEYLPFDLSGYIEALKDPREKCEKLTRPSVWLSMGEIKTIMRQLLRAVNFCHKNNVLHRDLKTANLLMNQEGTIKLADFGLARLLPHGKGLLTNRVVTLWYRPPELLLGSESYDFSLDLWSVGCIMAELVSGTHIFAADKEFVILKLICENLGFPDEVDLKYLRTLPLWNDKHSNPLHPEKIGSIITKQREFEKIFTKVNQLGSDGWDLMKKLFAWSPSRRITAKQALLHPWFTNEPLPKMITSRNNIKTAHSFMTKNQRKRESLKASQKRYDYVKYANTGEIRKVLKKQLSITL